MFFVLDKGDDDDGDEEEEDGHPVAARPVLPLHNPDVLKI